MEGLVADALRRAGIGFLREMDVGNDARLDFYLPDRDVYVEVKRFHSPRIAAQTARAANVIVLQGEAAVRTFCTMLSRNC